MKKAALPIFVILTVSALALLLLIDRGFFAETLQTVNTGEDLPNEEMTDASTESVTEMTSDQPTAQARLVEIQDEPIVLFDSAVQSLSDSEADAISRRYHAVGVQCAVVENGVVTGSYTYGYADRANGRVVTQDTKYRIASLSKLVTDMVFMKLSDNGLVSLDADISDYYGFSVRNPSYPEHAITPRMLMTHTASVVDGYMFNRSLDSGSAIPIREVLADGSVYSVNEPGTCHAYSNFSNALVGSVCELASGKCFEALVQEFFLDPVGADGGYVASSIENIDEFGLLYGGSSTLETQLAAQFSPVLGQTVHLVQGNLTISAVDYAKILCLLLNNGKNANGTQLLSPASVAEILRVQFATPRYGVGLGSFIYDDAVSGRTLYCHTGSAYGMYACYAMDPVTKDGVVVLTSGADYSVDADTEIYSICLDFIRLFLA